MAELGAFGPLTASGMILFVVWLIFRGRLVPRLYYDELRADRDRWRAAAETREVTAEEMAKLTAELVEVGLIAKRVLQSLPPGG